MLRKLTTDDIGKTLIDKDGGERKILGVLGDLVFISEWKSWGKEWEIEYSHATHIEQLRRFGWTLKEEEPKKWEEVAEWLADEGIVIEEADLKAKLIEIYGDI
jgi:hypothetical protein